MYIYIINTIRMVTIIKFNLLISHITKSSVNHIPSHSLPLTLSFSAPLSFLFFLSLSFFLSLFSLSHSLLFLSFFPSFFSGSLVGAQLVVTSDDGYVVTWNGNSLRQQSEEMYRRRHSERRTRTNAEILLDTEWQESRYSTLFYVLHRN